MSGINRHFSYSAESDSCNIYDCLSTFSPSPKPHTPAPSLTHTHTHTNTHTHTHTHTHSLLSLSLSLSDIHTLLHSHFHNSTSSHLDVEQQNLLNPEGAELITALFRVSSWSRNGNQPKSDGPEVNKGESANQFEHFHCPDAQCPGM